ncbi:hypothetical protein TNCT_359001 [Trichonephila clavata]|uniref:Uncharacterized protein n=1 Tax=Trichonephila clavata TaxID=2740835 RepID=A0A8X6HL13_TRICU|nr:hypothetical protein TNCT_359001 [Trichonephila clavata]
MSQGRQESIRPPGHYGNDPPFFPLFLDFPLLPPDRYAGRSELDGENPCTGMFGEWIGLMKEVPVNCFVWEFGDEKVCPIG